MFSQLIFDTQATEADDVTLEAIPDSQIASQAQIFGVEEPSDTQPNEGPSRKRKRDSEPRRMQWSSEKTARLMSFFIDCHREGLFRSSKKVNFKEAWERVRARAIEEWPVLSSLLTVTTISNKYDNERKRFVAWKAWVSLSGNSCDPETGVCDVDREDARWQSFMNVHGIRKVGWIAGGLPLGNVALYQELWAGETAKGTRISRPFISEDELVEEPAPVSGLDFFNGVIDLDRESEGGKEVSVESPDDTSWRPITFTTTQRIPVDSLMPPPPTAERLTAEQLHRRATDPDLVAAARESEGVNVLRGRRRRVSGSLTNRLSSPASTATSSSSLAPFSTAADRISDAILALAQAV